MKEKTLFERAKEAIEELDSLGIFFGFVEEQEPKEEAAEEAANKVETANRLRLIERFQFDTEKLSQIVIDLENLIKYHPTQSKEEVRIKFEEIYKRFRDLLGPDYQDPMEEYKKVLRRQE